MTYVIVERFVKYDGPKGNAAAFADVRVHTPAGDVRYPDVKLYRVGNQLRLSPKQERTALGTWRYSYEIRPEHYEPIRRALIERLREEQTGQLSLFPVVQDQDPSEAEVKIKGGVIA